jgi:hypothetical protein
MRDQEQYFLSLQTMRFASIPLLRRAFRPQESLRTLSREVVCWQSRVVSACSGRASDGGNADRLAGSSPGAKQFDLRQPGTVASCTASLSRGWKRSLYEYSNSISAEVDSAASNGTIAQGMVLIRKRDAALLNP